MTKIKIVDGVVTLAQMSHLLSGVSGIKQEVGCMIFDTTEHFVVSEIKKIASHCRIEESAGMIVISRNIPIPATTVGPAEATRPSEVQPMVIPAPATTVEPAVVYTQPTRMVEICNGCDRPIDDCECDYCEACDEMGDNCTCDNEDDHTLRSGDEFTFPEDVAVEVCKHEMIEHAYFSNDDFIIKTKMIKIGDKEIGQFAVKISTKETNISFYNLTKRYGSAQHPHIRGNGACFGNVESSIVSAIANNELAVASTLIIAFLETADENDSWGRIIKEWN